MRMARRAGLVLGLALALASCGSLLPKRDESPPALYQLNAAKDFKGARRALNVQLSVDEPAAPRGLDIDRIAIKPSPYEIKYLAGARWSDRAPRMVQMLLVESFDNAISKGGVSRPGEGLRADYLFASELRNFEVDDTGAGPPRIAMRLSAKILTTPGGKLVAARSFAHEVEARGRSTSAVVAAFDEAFNRVASASVQWTLETLGARAANGEQPVARSEETLSSPAP
jgi:cholesterol transport system auxiliary component